MKVLIPTTRFKKDLKRYRHNPELIQELYKVFDFIRKNEALPRKYKAHKLSGQYDGFWECHVENDTLLIWVDEENNIVSLVRFGSHSEVF
jgi:mRNA interferase YafQ